MDVETKKCTKCLNIRQKTDFGNNNRSADRLNYWCRPCYAEKGKQIHSNNMEIINEQKIKLLTNEGEIWKIITGANDYKVSNMGRIMSCKGCPIILKQTHRNNDNKSISLHYCGKVKTFLVHRLVAIMFLEGSSMREIKHINGDKSDNRVCNLQYIAQIKRGTK